MEYTSTISHCMRTAASRILVKEGDLEIMMSGMVAIAVTRGDDLSLAVKESR